MNDEGRVQNMHFCRNMGALFKNKMSHISQVKVRLLLRGVAYDNRSLSGSLRECVPPLRLDLKVGIVLFLLVQISVKFDTLGPSKHTRLPPTYELCVYKLCDLA